MVTELTLPRQLAQRDTQRQRTYRQYLDFYNGLQWPGTPRRRERRLTFNYARAFIDKLASYLTQGMAVVAEPWGSSSEAADRAQRAQEALLEVAAANALEQLDYETEVDASILGDGCFKVIQDPDPDRGGWDSPLRVTAPDVQGIFAWWAGDDLSRVWRIASRYQLAAEGAEDLYGITPRGAEATAVEVWTATHFALWADDLLLEERANPYGFIPFLLFPNLREPKKFWGLSDIPPLMEPQRELNRAFSQLSTIMELSGNPIAVLEGVEEAQDIAVQPGAVWELPQRARAYLLDLLQGGGVRLHTEFIDLLYRALHDLSEAPRTAFGDNQRNLSGVALEMELHPLLQKVRRKRLIRAAVYRRRAEMVLRLLQQRTAVQYLPVRLRVTWGPVMPQDRGRLVREEQMLVDAGLHSRRRAMAELGVEDPETELARVREETSVGKLWRYAGLEASLRPRGDISGAMKLLAGAQPSSQRRVAPSPLPRQRLRAPPSPPHHPRLLQEAQPLLDRHHRVRLNIEDVVPNVADLQKTPRMLRLHDGDHVGGPLEPVLGHQLQLRRILPPGPALGRLIDLLARQSRLQGHQIGEQHSFAPMRRPGPVHREAPL